jgi:glutaredoxin
MNSWGFRSTIAGFTAVLLLGSMAAAQAQTIYRIVGADGKVTFSDKPPASPATVNVTGTGSKAVSAASDTSQLPYELRQSMARYPVTLYAGPGCVPCNAGRLLLQGRGVPYTEYIVSSNADIEAFQRITGDNTLPFLTIGGQKIKGFSQTEWTQYLNAANYPTSSRLPSRFSFAAAKPLVTAQPVEPPADAAAAAPTSATAEQAPGAAAPLAPPAPPPAATNPAGIKF